MSMYISVVRLIYAASDLVRTGHPPFIIHMYRMYEENSHTHCAGRPWKHLYSYEVRSRGLGDK